MAPTILRQEIIKLLEIISRLNKIFPSTVPFQFNNKTKKAEVDHKRVNLSRAGNIVISLAFVSTAIRTYFWKKAGQFENFELGIIVLYMILLTNFVSTYWMKNVRGMCCSINTMLTYLEFIYEKWIHNYNPWSDKNFQIFMMVKYGGLFLLAVIPIFLTTHFIISPQQILYPTSLLPSTLFSSPILGILFSPILWYIYCCFGVMCLTHFIMVFTFGLFAAPLVSTEYRVGLSAYKTKSGFRSPTVFPVAYKALVLLVDLACDEFGPTIPVVQAINSQIILICNYITIKALKQRQVGWDLAFFGNSIGSATFVSTYLIIGGIFAKESKKTLSSWKQLKWNPKDMKYLSKFKRGCKPALYLGYPGYVKITKKSLPKFIQGCLRGTLKTLLALG